MTEIYGYTPAGLLSSRQVGVESSGMFAYSWKTLSGGVSNATDNISKKLSIDCFPSMGSVD